jgi:hypothetical protein
LYWVAKGPVKFGSKLSSYLPYDGTLESDNHVRLYRGMSMGPQYTKKVKSAEMQKTEALTWHKIICYINLSTLYCSRTSKHWIRYNDLLQGYLTAWYMAETQNWVDTIKMNFREICESGWWKELNPIQWQLDLHHRNKWFIQ